MSLPLKVTCKLLRVAKRKTRVKKNLSVNISLFIILCELYGDSFYIGMQVLGKVVRAAPKVTLPILL